MSEKDQNEKQPYNADDIRRYLAGEMPAREMHALEQASLDDPMLEEALMGMREIKADTRGDLTLLRQRLAERTAGKKSAIPFRRSWPKIAAALIVMIALSGAGYYFISGTASRREIAATGKTTDSAPGLSAPRQQPAAAAPATSTAVTDSNTRNQTENQDESDPVQEKAKSSLPGSRTVPAKTRLEKNAKPVPGTGAAPDRENRDLQRAAVRNEKKKTGMVKEEEIAAAPEPLSGSETNADKDSERTAPRSTAAVARAPQNQADAENLPAVPATLEGKAAGLETSQGGGRKNTNPSFSGQVVDDKGIPVSSVRQPSGPVPVPGWKKYRKYLGANKNQPTIDSSLHGTERISFSISQNGQPVNFSFDESLSSEHDTIAVRMIRNGPKWKPAKDSAHRVSLALPY